MGSFFVLITVVLAFLLAIIFNRRLKGTTVYMVIIFVPWMLSEIVSGIMFRWLFLPQFGLLQNWLAPLVGETPILASGAGAMGVVIGATVWRSLAFATLLILAGMQTIASELYDAAAIDGASGWQRFRYITWPLVRPTTTITVLFLTIQAVNAAGMFLAITDGGPGRSTEVLSLFMYREALEFFNFGYAAALSVIMLGLNSILALIYLRVLRD
ncbi:MAG: sugar ABC transporter permease [Blastochloris sp.]|nr:sugar ABC transporter permease [Blastochloris sp.]